MITLFPIMRCVIDFYLLEIKLSYHIDLESGNIVRIEIFDIANNTIYWIRDKNIENSLL